MNVYIPGRDADLLLAKWWFRLEGDGALDDLFFGNTKTLGGMMAFFQPPKGLMFEADEHGIWFAMWYEQMLSGAFVGAWLAPECRRGGPRGIRAFLEAYEWLLERAPCLLGVTKQERLLKVHAKMGYTTLGKLPGFWAGDDAWAVVLTREGFTKALARYRRASPVLEGMV